MLTDKEIAEIEEDFSKDRATLRADFILLLATVKELRKENTEQRELLRKAQDYIQCLPSCVESAHPCFCGAVLMQNQIKEAGK